MQSPLEDNDWLTDYDSLAGSLLCWLHLRSWRWWLLVLLLLLWLLLCRLFTIGWLLSWLARRCLLFGFLLQLLLWLEQRVSQHLLQSCLLLLFGRHATTTGQCLELLMYLHYLTKKSMIRSKLSMMKRTKYYLQSSLSLLLSNRPCIYTRIVWRHEYWLP